MADRLGTLVASASAGAIATLAGIFIAKKVKSVFAKPPEMKTVDKKLNLSTRCCWLITELGVEEDFVEGIDCPHYPPENPLDELTGLPMLTGPEKVDRMYPDYPREEHRRSELPVVKWGDPIPDDQSEACASIWSSVNSVCSRIPTTVSNDEFSMIEGAAICLYLTDLYGQLLPEPKYKSEYYSWIVYSAAAFDSLLRTLQEEMVDTPPSRQNPSYIEPAVQGFHAFVRAIEETLQYREYLCGETFTAADCVIGFNLWWAYTIDNGVMLSEHPRVCEYLDRLKERPAFKRTFLRKDDEWSWGKVFHTHLKGITNY